MLIFVRVVGVLFFIVYFWRESPFIASVGYRMLSCDGVWYGLVKIIFRERIGGHKVWHECSVVCGAKKFIVNLERSVPFLLCDLDCIDFSSRESGEGEARVLLLGSKDGLVVKHADVSLGVGDVRHVAVGLCAR